MLYIKWKYMEWNIIYVEDDVLSFLAQFSLSSPSLRYANVYIVFSLLM